MLVYFYNFQNNLALAVSHLIAQVKLTEMRTIENLENFPIKVDLMTETEGNSVTRNVTNKANIIKGKIAQMFKCFIG